MQVQSSQFFGEKPKKDVSFLKDTRISITKLYDDMAILLRKFEFSGKKYSPSKINKAKEILSRIYNFTQNGNPYVGWYSYMCAIENTGLSRPTVMQYFKDFKEAGLIKYELTFYKGKPVTYIHTTEVVDCFFMQIASGDKDNVIINDIVEINMTTEEAMQRSIDIKTRRQEEARYYSYGCDKFERKPIGEIDSRFLPEYHTEDDKGLMISKPEIVKIMGIAFNAIKKSWITRIDNNDVRLLKYEEKFKNAEEFKAEITKISIQLVKNTCQEVHLFYKSKLEQDPYHSDTIPLMDRIIQFFKIDSIFKSILEGISYYDNNNNSFNSRVPATQTPKTVLSGEITIKTKEQIEREIEAQRSATIASENSFEKIKRAFLDRSKESIENTQTCPPSKRFENAKKKNAEINSFEREKLNANNFDTVQLKKIKDKEPTQIGSFIGMAIEKNKN